jgi:hypothetical protein
VTDDFRNVDLREPDIGAFGYFYGSLHPSSGNHTGRNRGVFGQCEERYEGYEDSRISANVSSIPETWMGINICRHTYYARKL